VVSAAVVRLGGGTGAEGVAGGWGTDSDVSLLNSPALRMLFGLLLRWKPPGDAVPGAVEPGRLSPRSESMNESIFLRSSALEAPPTLIYGYVSILPQHEVGGRRRPTSLRSPPMLGRLSEEPRRALARLSSASLAAFARISSRRCSISAGSNSHCGSSANRGCCSKLKADLDIRSWWMYKPRRSKLCIFRG
jgi:hypothetical protein